MVVDSRVMGPLSMLKNSMESGGQACDLEIVNVVNRAGVLEQRRHIGGDDGTVLTLANDERAVLRTA